MRALFANARINMHTFTHICTKMPLNALVRTHKYVFGCKIVLIYITRNKRSVRVYTRVLGVYISYMRV